ncbi:reverse transcriptase family protein [Desulfobacterales bacterium HSG16]|nr:reverse transcriptase family protein [Desulfobacterales bacterium HSG16]
MATRTDMTRLWRDIETAGGIDAYVDTQLTEHGYLVEKKETDGMSRRELARYKKELKQEAEEKRKLKKEAWQAYKATHIVHLGEGIYFNDAEDWDRRDLEKAEERAAENELPQLDSPKQLAEALGLTIPKLRWLSYHRDAATRIHYRRFFISKRDGSSRPIWAPLPDLKGAQRWILNNIVERLPVHGACHGFLCGRSILTNAKFHENSSVIVKMDLKDFFPTVTFPRVKGLFRKAGYREQVATILSLLCTESPREIVDFAGKTFYVSTGIRCLPQGAPASPAITNTLCLNLDRRLSGLASKMGWRYTRYADDLTFSLPEKHKDAPKIGTLMGIVSRIVQDEGFTIHGKKTRVIRKGSRQTVTGLVVNDALAPRVPRKLKRRIRAAVFNLKNGRPLKDGDTPESLAGYAAYINMTDPKTGKILMDQLAPFL